MSGAYLDAARVMQVVLEVRGSDLLKGPQGLIQRPDAIARQTVVYVGYPVPMRYL